MRNKIRNTIEELKKIYSNLSGETLLRDLITRCQGNLSQYGEHVGRTEVNKFKALVDAFNEFPITQIENASISLRGYPQRIHGTSIFTVYHDCPDGDTQYCEVGDIMWLSIVHNYIEKISFIRVNFMQNKDRDNQLRWGINKEQLHCLTNPYKMKVRTNTNREALSRYFNIEYRNTEYRNIEDNYEIVFSHYIASYGLFTDNDMITLPAQVVSLLQRNREITNQNIQDFYRDSSFCCKAGRNYPHFYKDISHKSKHFYKNTPRQSNHFHFLDYAPDIEEFIRMFMYFSVGELFYKVWDGNNPPSPFEPPGGSPTILISEIEIGRDGSMKYKNNNI